MESQRKPALIEVHSWGNCSLVLISSQLAACVKQWEEPVLAMWMSPPIRHCFKAPRDKSESQ